MPGEIPDDRFEARCACSTWLNPGDWLGRVHTACHTAICLPDAHVWPNVPPGPGIPCLECSPPDLEEAATTTEPTAGGGGLCADTVAAPGRSAEPRPPTTVATRRTLRNYRDRPTIFVEAPATVADLLEAIPPAVERILLTGPRIGGGRIAGLRAWAMPDRLPAGWTAGEHYLHDDMPTLRFRHDGRHQAVEISRAAAWYGEGDYGPAAVEAAHAILAAVIGRHFDRGHVLASPAATGRHLLSRAIPFGVEWPTMPDEIQTLIRATSGQGRVQMLTEPDLEEIPALVGYDGRLAYAALCRGLAGGIPTVDEEPTFEGYARARYEVTATVPAGWDHVGLLPAMADLEADAAPASRTAWRWPAEPGETFRSWVDGAELLIAQKHGWPFQIHRRIVWPAYRGAGPLDGWARRLLEVRTTLLAMVRAGEITLEHGTMAADATRAVLLHTIGALHGRRHRVIRETTVAGEIPPGARVDVINGETFRWEEDAPAAWPEFSHPEWSAGIWARARARLLLSPTGLKDRPAGMLTVPRRDLLACFTDAIYLTTDPQWRDDRAAGRLRLKFHRAGPLPAPRTMADMHSLTKEGTPCT